MGHGALGPTDRLLPNSRVVRYHQGAVIELDRRIESQRALKTRHLDRLWNNGDTMADERKPNPMPLPLVVQLGFAGSRRLLDAKQYPSVDPVRFEAKIETWLVERLHKLRQEIGLDAQHFFCGISSIAMGADSIFCKACRMNKIPMRVFLPQTRDEFLDAVGSEGPDFPSPYKEEALGLLNSEHVIQERLVSDATTRGERFEDVNREIVRVSDLLICLKRKEAQGTVGGTESLISRAVQRGKLVLVVEIGVEHGKPHFDETWRLPKRRGDEQKTEALPTPAEAFKPKLPKAARTVAGLNLPNAAVGTLPAIEDYAAGIKQHSSDTAGKMHRKFTRTAMIIICAHILATVFATIAVAFPTFRLQIVPALLGMELVLLAGGFWIHHSLHRTKTSYFWAEARLLAEVTRSVLAIGRLHVYLEHLFSLPFPAAIRPLLRTISVLHLQSTRNDRTPWAPKRDGYVTERLGKPPKGQIRFYARSARNARLARARLHMAFNVFWISAFLSTLTKLVLHFYLKRNVALEDLLSGIAGTLAIVMPVLAVAALSLAAALDVETQEHAYEEMLEFLHSQVEYLNTASSERDYARLVIETEYQLLGETATWFSRRSFKTVG
jgi:FtsH-binding integral membrane protein